MVDLLVGGIGLGLILSIMLGPVFFILLETSIKKGVKSALFMDLGVLISDIMYISIAYIFVNQVAILQTSKNAYWLSIIGGVIFILFGFYTIRKKGSKKSKPKGGINPSEIQASNYFTTIIKGFFLNAVNPGVLFYWLTIIGTLRGKTNIQGFSEDGTVLLYLLVILITFFGIDVFKIIGAKKLKNVLTPAWMTIINRVLGIILVCFGFIFLFQGILTKAGL